MFLQPAILQAWKTQLFIGAGQEKEEKSQIVQIFITQVFIIIKDKRQEEPQKAR